MRTQLFVFLSVCLNTQIHNFILWFLSQQDGQNLKNAVQTTFKLYDFMLAFEEGFINQVFESRFKHSVLKNPFFVIIIYCKGSILVFSVKEEVHVSSAYPNLIFPPKSKNLFSMKKDQIKLPVTL